MEKHLPSVTERKPERIQTKKQMNDAVIVTK